MRKIAAVAVLTFFMRAASGAMMTDYPLAPGSYGPSKQPQGIALGADGSLCVAAFAANSIVRFSAGVTTLQTW